MGDLFKLYNASKKLARLRNRFLEVGVDDEVDAVVFEIDVARSEVADFESAFAAGRQHEGKMNFFFDAVHGVEKFEWLEKHSDEATEAGLKCRVLCL